MGCSCGKKRRKRTSTDIQNAGSFVLQTRQGDRQTFGSRLEAEAARVRAGGGEITRKR